MTEANWRAHRDRWRATINAHKEHADRLENAIQDVLDAIDEGRIQTVEDAKTHFEQVYKSFILNKPR